MSEELNYSQWEDRAIVEADWIDISGERDPNMTTKERKILRIFAYLGLNVYLFLVSEKRKLKNIYQRLRLLQPPPHESRNNTVEFYRSRDRQMTIAARKLSSCERKMYAIWNYLFDVPANFENPHPDGTEFINLLTSADVTDSSEDEEEVTPIANVSVGSSFGHAAGER